MGYFRDLLKLFSARTAFLPKIRGSALFLWGSLFMFLTVLDQGIKALVLQKAAESGTPLLYVAGDFFNIVLVKNQGISFGLFARSLGPLGKILFFIAAGVSVWAFWVALKAGLSFYGFLWTLLAAGALGNGLDRLIRGYVIDFLDFHWGLWHYPAFNIADICLSCAVGGYMIARLFQKDSPLGPTERS